MNPLVSLIAFAFTAILGATIPEAALLRRTIHPKPYDKTLSHDHTAKDHHKKTLDDIRQKHRLRKQKLQEAKVHHPKHSSISVDIKIEKNRGKAHGQATSSNYGSDAKKEQAQDEKKDHVQAAATGAASDYSKDAKKDQAESSGSASGYGKAAKKDHPTKASVDTSVSEKKEYWSTMDWLLFLTINS